MVRWIYGQPTKLEGYHYRLAFLLLNIVCKRKESERIQWGFRGDNSPASGSNEENSVDSQTSSNSWARGHERNIPSPVKRRLQSLGRYTPERT